MPAPPKEGVRSEAVAAAVRPTTPAHLHASAVGATSVTLSWRRSHGRHVRYEVFRNGRRVAVVKPPRFTDLQLQPGRSYRYRVRAVDAAKHRSKPTRQVKVRTRRGAGVPSVPSTLSSAMVDRLLWRAGFGPSPSDRDHWTGRPVAELVEHLLTTPAGYPPAAQPTTFKGQPPDPLATDTELMLEWLDRMVRAANPLVERLTLFWHRHWAVSRAGGSPAKAMVDYRDRMHRYADFASTPNAAFRDLAREMTTQDAAMLYWLTGFASTKGSPNENYAREFMELFCLGITDARGNPNYSQTDVHELARAFTGYTLDATHTQAGFDASRADVAAKTIFGKSGSFDALAAIEFVLGHPAHAPFIVTKLWHEFIGPPPPRDTLAQLVAAYGTATTIAPVLRVILGHPLLFSSLSEPDTVKPPIVFAVGVLRTLGAPLRDHIQTDALSNMQQQPYFPPNVAGWEGGLSWMNSTTAAARFDFVIRSLSLLPMPADIAGETPQAAFDRAYALCGSPWLSDPARAALLAYARQAPVATAAQRRQRQYTLVAFILGGPDGQVM